MLELPIKSDRKAGLEIASISDPGRTRAVNEDRVLAERLSDGSIILAVADGVGGMGGGDIAAEEAIQTLQAELTRDHVDDHAAALTRAFVQANKRVRLLYGSGGVPMATTLVAAFVRDDKVWVANVGDSRAYLLQDGRLEQLTHDHSLVAEQVAAGVLTEEQAEISDYANVITRGIGVTADVLVDSFGPIELAASSVLILCSDGLYRVVDGASLLDVLTTEPIDQVGPRLVALANEAGGPDNVSIVLCKRSRE